MMVFPSSVITEFFNGSIWVDISQYVVSEIKGEGGFPSYDPANFTASLGSSTFDLDNSGGLFTVYGGDSVRGLNTLAGWNKGTKIRCRVQYSGFDKEFWTGFVSEVVSDDGVWGDQMVHVTCLDWIDVAARYPMKQSEILTDKTLADGVQSIVNRISVAPEGVDADPSTTTFSAIFDNVRSKTKALGEIDKLARSEMAPVYVLKDGVLRVEGRQTRKGTTSLTQVPVGAGNALLVSADNALLISADNALLVSEIEDANLVLTSEKLDLRMRDEFWNDAYIRSYPTRTDTSLKVLFSIGSPIQVAAGVPISFVGNYTDPEGGNAVNGTNMQTPVATTDYLFNSASDGSGTNFTASGTITADYYGDVVVYQVVSPYTCWLTALQARGYGIYRTSYTESHILITGSANTYGEKTFDLNQTYQSEPYSGQVYGASVLELYKTPKTRIASARYCANLNSSQMLACMYLDIGSLIRVYDGRSNMYKRYHITSRNFVILLGGIIILTLGLIEHLSISSGGLEPAVVDFNPTGTGDAVDFGYITGLYDDDTTEFSIGFWMYPREVPASSRALLQISAGTQGSIGISTYGGEERISFTASKFSHSVGWWDGPTGSFNLNEWSHVVLTYQINTSSDPTLYINGVPQVATEMLAPTGTYVSSVGAKFVVGNSWSHLIGINAKMADVRYYKNKILTAQEVTEIYNGGVIDMSAGTKDGLAFQGLAVNSDLGDAASLDGQSIPAGNNYFDNIFRSIGKPHGSPVIRDFP